MGRFWVSTPAQRMVAEQLRPHGVTDERVLEAMASVPREEFLAPRMRRHAYEDRALAIECGQTISQPLVVASMAQAASPQLADGGRMVIPVALAADEPQDLRVYTRHGEDVTYRSLFPVLFVPLRPD